MEVRVMGTPQEGSALPQSPGTSLRQKPPLVNTTVVFVGHARLPQSLVGRELSPVVSVELEVDISSNRVVETAARAVPPLAEKLLEQALLGRDVRSGPEAVVEEVHRRYICPSQRAICTAIINAYEAYYRYQQQVLAS
ncbi:MAG: DUF3870 domain-containing protein [Dehalococcoidia bacterium]